MKNVFPSILLLCSLLVALFAPSCKDKCKPCNSGAECVDGQCACEPGRFYFNANCVYMDAESYVGINPACYCYDTLAIGIIGSGTIRQLGMPVKSGSSVASMTQTVFYYELSDGDSLYSPELALRCFAPDDTPLKPAAYGKKQPDGSWKLHLEFHNAFTQEVVDNCTVILKKFL